ncbi:MAG: hypothetical protein R8K46_01580 [Mariprofundaceae bacterium]
MLAGCSASGASQIHELLDARDQAIETQDVGAYSWLIADDYSDGELDKVGVVARMISLFDQFDDIHIESFSRELRFLDDDHAQCAQSYRMTVSVDDISQELVQRESLDLARRQGRWLIVAGL